MITVINVDSKKTTGCTTSPFDDRCTRYGSNKRELNAKHFSLFLVVLFSKLLLFVLLLLLLVAFLIKKKGGNESIRYRTVRIDVAWKRDATGLVQYKNIDALLTSDDPSSTMSSFSFVQCGQMWLKLFDSLQRKLERVAKWMDF